jgi:putative aldouronate transport system permease protein
MVRDRSVSSIILDVIIYTTLSFVFVICLFPILHVASVSLSSPQAAMSGSVSIFPRDITIDAYRTIIRAGSVPRGFRNSLIYTSIGTAINLMMTVLMAYPLSKKHLTFRSFYMVLIMITMFFSGGLIPQFLLVRSLNMYNKIWALVIPGAISAWNLIIMRTLFQSMPAELDESAYLDGANDFVVLFRIVLPLSKAALATIGLFYAVSHWNSFFTAIIYLRNAEKYPLQVILRQIVLQNQIAEEMAQHYIDDPTQFYSESIKYATLFSSLLPMMMLYPFLQKYFVKGIMIGSLKG